MRHVSNCREKVLTLGFKSVKRFLKHAVLEGENAVFAVKAEFLHSQSQILNASEYQLADARERLTRLEVSRDADRTQMQANLARFQAEVERAEMRLTRLLPTQGELHQLPEPGEKR